MTALTALNPLPVPPGHGAEVAKNATVATPAGGSRAADDDDGGFAAALGDARARADDGETDHAKVQSASNDACDPSATDDTDAPPAADPPPAADLAQWLPGWPPTAPAAAAPAAIGSAADTDTADEGAVNVPAASPTGSFAPMAATLSATPPAALSAAARSTSAPGAMPVAESDRSAIPESSASGTDATPRAGHEAPVATRGPIHLAMPEAIASRTLAAQAGDVTPRTAAASDSATAAKPAAARPTDGAPGAASWGTMLGLAARDGRPEGAATASAPFQAHLAAALDSPAFAPALATQVKWLLREGVQHAQLSLNPADMGPLTVHIAVDGTQARIDFSAEIAATRSTIETSLPTLAAALHASGLTLAGGGVFDGQPRHSATPGRAAANGRGRGDGGALAAGTGAAEAVAARRPRGLVDLVA